MDAARWERIKDVVERALDVQPTDRDGWVVRACGGDEHLLAEVRTLVRAAGMTHGFLERATAQLTDTATRSPAPDESKVGRRVAHYLLRERIGRGGMGEVYRAQDVALGREAALKLLPAAFDARLRDQLVHEAEASAQLQHPSIATFYEGGHADGETFIAMEFVRGCTLRDRLHSGPLSTQESLAIAASLLEALAHAHAAGLIHRDIKPENVMLADDGSTKLLDFGIALRPAAGADALCAGTVGYMAPEQAAGDPLDARTDVFQLGTLLFEMLTGTPAFGGSSPFERLAALLTAELDFSAVQQSCGPEVVRLLARATARDPNDRYDSARAFLGSLRRLDEPGMRATDTLDSYVSAGVQASRMGKGSLEDARIILERTIADDPQHAAALAELSSTYAMRSIATTDARDVDLALTLADRALAIDPRNVKALVWKGYALNRQGRAAEAAKVLRVALTLGPSDTEACYFAGAGLYVSGQRPEALELLQRAVQLDERRGMWWLALGTVHLSMEHREEARYCFDRARKLEAAPGPNGIAGAAAYVAETLRRDGLLPEARAEASAGLESAERSDHVYRDTFRAHALVVLGRVALDQGDASAAAAAFQQVLAQARGRQRTRGCGHFVVQALAGLARAASNVAHLDAAGTLFATRETYNFETFFGATDDETLFELAQAARALGSVDVARELFRRACDAGCQRADAR